MIFMQAMLCDRDTSLVGGSKIKNCTNWVQWKYFAILKPHFVSKNMVLWVTWNFFYLFKTCCQNIFSTI